MRKLVLLLATVAALFTAMAGTASAGTLFFNIKVAHTGKCLDVDTFGGGLGNGVRAQQWACLGAQQHNQVFKLEDTGGGVYRIIAVHSNKCLDVAGAATGDGAAVIQFTCVSGSPANQRWTFEFDGNGRYLIRSKLNGKCLDIDTFGGGTANGVKAQMWRCLANTQLNQRWTLVSI